jgi:homoserine kinase
MSVRVSVPATSANLGPGFDSMAVALDLELVVEVEAADEFSLVANIDVPQDRSNLLVQAFERVLPADGYAFRVDSAIPLCGGLGSSSCAALGGVLAACALGGEVDDPLALAIEVDGVTDNSIAAWHGGVAIHADGTVVRIDPPKSVAPILVIPAQSVNTADARSVLPEQVPMADAVANLGLTAILAAGLATDDVDVIALGLGDRIHQERRSGLFPNSWGLVQRAEDLGALGATISGSGAAVLVWAASDEAETVAARVEADVAGWASVVATGFSAEGAKVNGEAVA